MMILLLLSVFDMFMCLKQSHQAFSRSSYILSLYKNSTFIFLLIIYLIEFASDVISHSLIIIPFLATPFISYALEGLFSIKSNPSNAANYTNFKQIQNYIYSLLTSIGKSESTKSNYLNTKVNRINRCYLLTMLTNHFRICQNQMCVCRSIMGKLMQNNNDFKNQQERKLWLCFAKEQLNEFLEKYPKEANLYIVSASLKYYWLNNYFTALIDLSKLKSLYPSISTKITAFYITRLIEEDFMNENCSHLADNIKSSRSYSTIRINRYMKLYSRFIVKMEDCINISIRFWTILLKDDPNPQALIEAGNRVFYYMKQLHQFYKELIQCNPANVNFLFKY